MAEAEFALTQDEQFALSLDWFLNPRQERVFVRRARDLALSQLIFREFKQRFLDLNPQRQHASATAHFAQAIREFLFNVAGSGPETAERMARWFQARTTSLLSPAKGRFTTPEVHALYDLSLRLRCLGPSPFPSLAAWTGQSAWCFLKELCRKYGRHELQEALALGPNDYRRRSVQSAFRDFGDYAVRCYQSTLECQSLDLELLRATAARHDRNDDVRSPLIVADRVRHVARLIAGEIRVLRATPAPDPTHEQ